MKEPKVFAKELINRVNSLEGNYDDNLYVLFAIISEGERSIKGTSPICTLDDFCKSVGFYVPMGKLKEFIKETQKEIIPFVKEELEVKPKSIAEAMTKVIYYHLFYLGFDGIYQYCYEIYNNIDGVLGKHETAMLTAITADKIREEL